MFPISFERSKANFAPVDARPRQKKRQLNPDSSSSGMPCGSIPPFVTIFNHTLTIGKVASVIETKKCRNMPPRPASPGPLQVCRGRAGANLTAVAAGDIICLSGRAWTKYEQASTKPVGPDGKKSLRMNGALWRYFCMVTNQFDLL